MPSSFQLILIGVLLLVFVTLGYGLLMLFRWKVSFEGKEIVALPSDKINELFSSVSTLSKSIAKTKDELHRSSHEQSAGHSKVFERVQALLKAVSETRSEYRTLRDEIESKNAELQRYKEGYDLRIIRKCLEPVLASHSLTAHELTRSDISDEHRQFAEAVQESFADLMSDFDIRIDAPKTGGEFRKEFGISLPPETIPAKSTEQIGTIAEVKTPRYLMHYDGNAIVIREAQVVVYSELSDVKEH